MLERATCIRCGYGWDVIDRPHRSGLCESCRTRKARTQPSNLPKPCKPWAGEFDQYDRPIVNGELYLPGRRICWHTDCVEITHLHEKRIDMALTTVQGTVLRTITGPYGAGVQIAEEITTKTGSFNRTWMCWFAVAPELADGDVVTITGGLQVKLATDKATGQLKTYTKNGVELPYQDFSLTDCVFERQSNGWA